MSQSEGEETRNNIEKKHTHSWEQTKPQKCLGKLAPNFWRPLYNLKVCKYQHEYHYSISNLFTLHYTILMHSNSKEVRKKGSIKNGISSTFIEINNIS